MGNNVIEISGLTKKYGSFVAVNNLSLSLKKGEIFGLLGPNGAGKSTTMLMLIGLTEPDAGHISVMGINPVKNPVEVKKMVGYLPEDVGFYDNLSGWENIVYTARLNGMSGLEATEQACAIIEKVGLKSEKDKKAGKYSRGMRQRLGLADVLIKKPRIIILDEPTLGIDPSGIREFLDLIVKLSREEGITVIFSSHHLHQVQQVCDRVGIFVNGKLLADGDVNSLARQLFLTSAYTIEAEISTNGENEGDENSSVSRIIRCLAELDGVEKVSSNKMRLQIECSRNVSTEVARVIVNSGVGLCSLNKREYGLDDIYYKYFEGGNSDE